MHTIFMNCRNKKYTILIEYYLIFQIEYTQREVTYAALSNLSILYTGKILKSHTDSINVKYQIIFIIRYSRLF